MKWLILFLWGGAILYLQLRGQVRLPWQRQLLHASSALAPLSAGALVLSKVPNTPTVPNNRLSALKSLEDDWQTIRDEALAALVALEDAKSADSGTVQRTPLVTAGKPNPAVAETCPELLSLLQQMPGLDSAAIMALPPNASTEPDRAPYAGLLRAQLTLTAPSDALTHTDVDGIRYPWQEGQCLLLDPAYVTTSNNSTDQTAVALVCEIERPMTADWAQRINQWFSRQVVQTLGLVHTDKPPRPIEALINGRRWLERQWQGFEQAYRDVNPTLYKAVQVGLVVLAILLFLAI